MPLNKEIKLSKTIEIIIKHTFYYALSEKFITFLEGMFLYLFIRTDQFIIIIIDINDDVSIPRLKIECIKKFIRKYIVLMIKLTGKQAMRECKQLTGLATGKRGR